MKKTTAQFAAVLLIAMAVAACSRTTPNRNPIGETFPRVNGTSLAEKSYTIPDDFKGAPTLLIVGYVQDAQFDIDRWLLGLAQAKTPGRMYEVPAAKGLGARAASGFIDNGMRSGIPQEDWGVVITVYRDAGKIVEFLGNDKPRNARVVLLDAEGRVVWHHDRGYSATKLLELDSEMRKANANGRP